MAIKTQSGMSGKVKLFDRMIAFSWKGIQAFRNEPRSVSQPHSTAQILVREALTLSAQQWFSALTHEQRNAWETYARSAGERDQRVGDMRESIIKGKGIVLSGFNAFCGSNVMAAIRGITIPRPDAPIGVPAPTPPLNVYVTYNPATGIAEVSWSDPDVSAYPTDAEVYVAVWAAITCGRQRGNVRNVPPQIIAAYPVPTPENMTFTHIKSRGRAVKLSKFEYGELKIQMDTITSGKVPPTDTGFRASPPSSIARTIILPA
jgi:hypothetical protein